MILQALSGAKTSYSCYAVSMARKKHRKIHNITLREQIKKEPGLFVVYILLRTAVVGVMIAQILNKDWQNVMLCIYTLFLFTIPSFVEKNWHIDIPNTLEVIILIFIFAAEILGEIRAFYVSVPGWDTALHTITGFLSAAVGFSLVDIINRNEYTKLYLSPIYVAIAAFCFSMMLDTTASNRVVSIYGITEVSINGEDLGLGGYLDIGLIDTMKDLFVNLIGAVVFSIIGFFYIKGRGKGHFAKRFMPTLMSKKKEISEL